MQHSGAMSLSVGAIPNLKHILSYTAFPSVYFSMLSLEKYFKLASLFCSIFKYPEI